MSAAGPAMAMDTAVSDGAAVVAAVLASSAATTVEPAAPTRTVEVSHAANGTAAATPTVADASGDTARDAAPATAPATTPAAATAEPVEMAPAAVTGTAPVAKTIATTQAAPRPTFGETPSPASSFGSTVLALLLVVGLILVLGWLARRMPGFGRGSTTNGLRVVTSMSIGARERLVVVEVGQTQLLVGVGSGGMRTLHTLEEPLAPVAAPAASPFAQLLAQQFGKKA